MENIIRKFEWESRWLKGEEYFQMLKNVEQYSSQFSLQKLSKKSHPLEIYQKPSNGLIYFIQGENLDSDFGFPRVEIKKTYKWKKMNFSAELPKKNPLVRYLVASASRKIDKGKAAFRMHAVALNERTENSFILCHVRQLHLEVEADEHIVKKAKREIQSPAKEGLLFLLDAANRILSPVKEFNKENDYVKMFKESKIDKFPALSSHFKPLFVISKFNNS
jgi:hypothetical protein